MEPSNRQCPHCGNELVGLNAICTKLPCIIARAKQEAEKPKHYTNQVPGIECIDVAKHFNYARGNIIKYAWRCGEKGDAIGDLQKIIKYAEFEIERIKEERNLSEPQKIQVEAEKPSMEKDPAESMQEQCASFLQKLNLPSYMVLGFTDEKGTNCNFYAVHKANRDTTLKGMIWAIHEFISEHFS